MLQPVSKSFSKFILGLSEGYHDSSCALLKDGTLIAAAQEERFSRIKNDKSLPLMALRYCLQAGGITIRDIDCIAYYEDPTAKLGRQLWMGLCNDVSPQRRSGILRRLAQPKPQDVIRQIIGFDGPIEIVDHHLSHAASSYYCSGFSEAAILTVDGVGDWPTTSYGQGRGSVIERFEQVDFPDSMGLFYSTITDFLGFEVNEGEYKVMGLASYGAPRYIKQLRQLIQTAPDGQFRLDQSYFSFLREDSMASSQLASLLGVPARRPRDEISKDHRDIARSAQVVLEELLLEKVGYLHSKAPSDNLCMAGGVALNVVANGRCLREGPFKRLFVQPAAGDAGTSIGAAALAHATREKNSTPHRLDHVYLGPPIEPLIVHKILEQSSAKYRDFRGRSEDMMRYTADKLAQGKVVGWAQGRMEFGPRALGARSILADPRRPEMRDRINSVIKRREGFRPFAPAVLETEASKHFALSNASPFMLETCLVTSEIKLPAITHVDGSARVQTVNSDTHPQFFALIREFFRRTGCPIVLNTSFNLKSEPIVCSELDAILCFVASEIDILVLSDFVIERAGIPPLWHYQVRRAIAEREQAANRVRRAEKEPTHVVYTLL